MVSIENMRNPKTKQLFSDDVRFSNKSKTCSSARTPASTNRMWDFSFEYTNDSFDKHKPQLTGGGRRRKPSRKQRTMWPRSKRKPTRANSPSVNPQTVIHTIYR